MADEMSYDHGKELGELDKSWSSVGANVKTSKYNTGGGSKNDDIPRSSNGKKKGSGFGKY
jgi:hypothetical protein